MNHILNKIFISLVILSSVSMLILSTQIAGMRLFVVTTSSMEPYLPQGSLLSTRYTPPYKIKVGDIITFKDPNNVKQTITHRVVDIQNFNGLLVFFTKGDKNSSIDVWKVAEGGIIGKLQFFVPRIGYMISILRTKVGIILGMIIPSLYIMYKELRTIRELTNTLSRNSNNASLSIILFLLLSILTIQSTQCYLASSVTLQKYHIKTHAK